METTTIMGYLGNYRVYIGVMLGLYSQVGRRSNYNLYPGDILELLGFRSKDTLITALANLNVLRILIEIYFESCSPLVLQLDNTSARLCVASSLLHTCSRAASLCTCRLTSPGYAQLLTSPKLSHSKRSTTNPVSLHTASSQ